MTWEKSAMQTLEFTMFSGEGWNQIWLFSCLLSGSQNSGTSNEETRTLLIYRLIDPRVWERLDIQRILPTTVMSQFCKKACWVNMDFLSFLWGISSAASLFVQPFAYSCTLRKWASESISQSKFKIDTQVYFLVLKKCPKTFPFFQHLLSLWFWFIVILISLPSHSTSPKYLTRIPPIDCLNF